MDTSDQSPAESSESVLRTYIMSGALNPGDGLPPEKELTASLGLSRQALRGARTRLDAEGLLRVEHGSGSTLLDYRAHGSLLLLPHLDGAEVDQDALALRRVILSEMVAGAAARATFEDLADLDELCRLQGLSERPAEAFREGDLAFYERVAKAAGSLPLRFVFHGIADWLRARPQLHDRLLADRAKVSAGYEAMLNLVRGGDPELARKAVRGALERTEAALFEA